MRWLIAFGIIAGCQGNDKDESAVAQPHTTRPAAVAAPVAPTLDRSGAARPGEAGAFDRDAQPMLPEIPNAAAAFDRQPRDAEWAADAERDLRGKLTKVHGQLEGV